MDSCLPLHSLKDSLQTDLDNLDYFFSTLSKDTKENRQAIASWAVVRESAISFTELFDRINSIDKDISKGEES